MQSPVTQDIPDPYPDDLSEDEPLLPEPNAWIGGVVPIRLRDRRPVKVAAWITYSGIMVAAAEVQGDGAAVLRGLLVEALATTAPARIPEGLIVWPAMQEAVRGVTYPAVKLEHDDFLFTVVQDVVGIHESPESLQRRAS